MMIFQLLANGNAQIVTLTGIQQFLTEERLMKTEDVFFVIIIEKILWFKL